MVAPANMLASVCAASLFASVFVVLASVFMVFPLVSFCGGVCSGCSVSRTACPRLQVWTCWVGVVRHVECGRLFAYECDVSVYVWYRVCDWFY